MVSPNASLCKEDKLLYPDHHLIRYTKSGFRTAHFANDVEREEDYEIGWDWIEEDTGPLIGPYTGFHQCLLDPLKNKPEDFFNELFDVRMYTIMAKETNKYARRRKQNRKYKNFFYFLSKNNFFSQTLSKIVMQRMQLFS